jgi:glucuronate isomerase
MKFLSDDFLLENEMGKRLFHTYADSAPIIDFHCHLDPKAIYENKKYGNLTEIWLGDDHYKWRLMRTMGFPETLITGDGDDYDKFFAFTQTLERAYGNPIYEWTHLELRRFFGIDLPVDSAHAKEIWDQASALLQTDDFTPRALIRRSHVEVVCTTDDPLSDLHYHQLLAETERSFKVLPVLRPDRLIEITHTGFGEYCERLEALVGQRGPRTFASIVAALRSRCEFFSQNGCRLTDHSLSTYHYAHVDEMKLDGIVARAAAGESITPSERDQYVTALLLEMMKMNKDFDWTMQLHVNVNRSINHAAFRILGCDTGFDSMGTQTGIAGELMQLFSEASEKGVLPKMILYSLNPNDWMELVTMIDCFQGKGVQQLQLGAGWWYNDTVEGIERQLRTFASESLLSNFVGMVTDSRSFLSYPRHEYFRRVLCNFIGKLSEAGRVPADEELLGRMVQNISYNNARGLFDSESGESSESHGRGESGA